MQENTRYRKPLTEKEIRELLERTQLSLPPLRFERQAPDPRYPQVDLVFSVSWGNRTYRFVGEVKARVTAQAIIAASHYARSRAYEFRGSYPLVIVPYLSPSQLEEVENQGINAVDLCGNGVVAIPNELLVSRSGRPNQFRLEKPLKGAYRGTSSLVARALLLRARFDRVSDLHSFIREHDGNITLGTVSKALAVLAEDLAIARDARGVRVLQPDRLIDRLRVSFRPPIVRARWTGKIPIDEKLLHASLLGVAERKHSRLIMTGLASASQYVNVAMEPVASFYCSLEPLELLHLAKLDSSKSKAFPNVELLQTDDESVFFDPRAKDYRILSSPIQAWLEMAAGDKRTHEASEQLRTKILERLKATTEVHDER